MLDLSTVACRSVLAHFRKLLVALRDANAAFTYGRGCALLPLPATRGSALRAQSFVSRLASALDTELVGELGGRLQRGPSAGTGGYRHRLPPSPPPASRLRLHSHPRETWRPGTLMGRECIARVWYDQPSPFDSWSWIPAPRACMTSDATSGVGPRTGSAATAVSCPSRRRSPRHRPRPFLAKTRHLARLVGANMPAELCALRATARPRPFHSPPFVRARFDDASSGTARRIAALRGSGPAEVILPGRPPTSGPRRQANRAKFGARARPIAMIACAELRTMRCTGTVIAPDATNSCISPISPST